VAGLLEELETVKRKYLSIMMNSTKLEAVKLEEKMENS